LIFGRAVAFAFDIGGAQLEVVWYVCFAGPLDAAFIVVGASVFTAHDFDLMVTTAISTNTLKLDIVNMECTSLI
jgi:hypothetical protein